MNTKLRTLAAGLLLAVAIAPTAMAAPKTDPAPAPIGGSSSTVSPQFFCVIFPSFPICRH
ncbi:hypothetical protein [Tessaracoccus sp. G1721]